MHARLVSGVFLALGLADVAVLDLLLAPRLAAEVAGRASEAPQAPSPPAPVPIALAAPPPVAEPPPPPQPEPELKGAELLFALESTMVLDEGQEIDRLARELSARPGRQLVLRGHTDRLGGRAYNLALSRRRAESVARLLIARGASADRLVVEAVGDAEPIDPAWTPAAWAKNRRVQIVWR